MFLEIKSDPAELKEVRKQLDEFCAKNLKDIDIFKIKLSVDEALQNIIRHAYKMDKDKKIKKPTMELTLIQILKSDTP